MPEATALRYLWQRDMFEHTYYTRYGDIKSYNEVKTSAILDMLQDVAIKHSEECSYGLLRLQELNLAWFLQGIKLHFDKPVRTFEAVTLKTGVKNMKGFLSERCTYIHQYGEVIGKAVANWFLFDTDKMKICRITEDISSHYPIDPFEDSFFSYSRPGETEARVCDKIKISPRDIDTNHHLNNEKAVEILMSALPQDVFFTDINVSYKRSSFLGEELYICLARRNKSYYAHLKDGDGNIRVVGVFGRDAL